MLGSHQSSTLCVSSVIPDCVALTISSSFHKKCQQDSRSMGGALMKHRCNAGMCPPRPRPLPLQARGRLSVPRGRCLCGRCGGRLSGDGVLEGEVSRLPHRTTSAVVGTLASRIRPTRLLPDPAPFLCPSLPLPPRRARRCRSVLPSPPARSLPLQPRPWPPPPESPSWL